MRVLYLHFPKLKKLDEEKCLGFRKTGKPGFTWLTGSYAPGVTIRHVLRGPKRVILNVSSKCIKGFREGKYLDTEVC